MAQKLLHSSAQGVAGFPEDDANVSAAASRAPPHNGQSVALSRSLAGWALFAVHLFKGDKVHRDFGQQRLKLQPLFQDLLCPLVLSHFRLCPFVSFLQALLRNIKPRSKLLYLKEKLLICFTALFITSLRV
jgi:hypothetical protein